MLLKRCCLGFTIVVLLFVGGELFSATKPGTTKTPQTETIQTTNTTTKPVNTNIVETEVKENVNETGKVTTPQESEDIEYIAVVKKERGLRIYIELGGGNIFDAGVIWRISPVFGIGGGIGYNQPPYIDYGISIVLKAEIVPYWFDSKIFKLNILTGFNGVFFTGSGTQYLGATVGVELLTKPSQFTSSPFLRYLLLRVVPSGHIYLYLAGEKIAPKLAFQLRYSL